MVKSIISDMDGVVYRGNELIPGAQEFVQNLLEFGIRFLFLTNVSEKTPADLLAKMQDLGIQGLEEKHFITAGMATAMFLARQHPGARVYCIGGSGLQHELGRVGLVLTEDRPDYVVVGKTRDFHFSHIRHAVNFIQHGAKFVGANPDLIDPTEQGFEPACGSLLASIGAATGQKPYIVGKPNSLMMTLATRMLGVHPDDTLMIGDRMDTDIVGGLEAGMTTALVLSGVTTPEMLDSFPYKPDHVFQSVGDIDFQKLWRVEV